MIGQRQRRRGLFGAPRNRRLKPKAPVGARPPADAADAADAAAPPRPPLGTRLKAGARALARPLRTAGKILGALLLAGALGAGGVTGYRAVVASPRFMVREIRQSPTRHLAPAEVGVIVSVERGRNIFRVDLARIERDLAAHPWVARASARRELPDAIVVDIVEREPALLVELGGLYLADRTGQVFKRAETSETDGLVVVTGIERESYLRDRARAEGELRDALALAEAYAAGHGRPALGEIHLAETGFILYAGAGATAIRLGRHEPAAQLGRFDVVWRALGERQALTRAIYLDHRTRPDRVTLRLDPEPAAGAETAEKEN